MGFFLCAGLGVVDLVLINVSIGPAALAPESDTHIEQPSGPPSLEHPLAASIRDKPTGELKDKPKVVSKDEPKATDEPKAAPKDEPKAAPKDEPKAALKDEPKAVAKDIPKQPSYPKIELPSRPIVIFFRTADHRVSDEAKRRMQSPIALLKKWPALQVEVTGHADERGSAEKNRSYSERRALAVVKVLRAAGIPSARIHYQGLGDSKPADSRSVPEAWRRNRRAEIRLTKDRR